MEKKTELKLDLKFIVKLLLVVAMACFIFPFATVSCAGNAKVEASGIELMLATSLDGEDDYRDAAPNIFVIVATFDKKILKVT